MQLTNFSARERKFMQENLTRLATIATQMSESVVDPQRDIETVLNAITMSSIASSITKSITEITTEEAAIRRASKGL